jgi:hypothetical protein
MEVHLAQAPTNGLPTSRNGQQVDRVLATKAQAHGGSADDLRAGLHHRLDQAHLLAAQVRFRRLVVPHQGQLGRTEQGLQLRRIRLEDQDVALAQDLALARRCNSLAIANQAHHQHFILATLLELANALIDPLGSLGERYLGDVLLDLEELALPAATPSILRQESPAQQANEEHTHQCHHASHWRKVE